MSIARLMQMAAAGVPAGGWSNLTYVGGINQDANTTGSATRSYSVSDTISSDYTYFILTSNASSTGDYNSITGCTVNSTTATEVLNIGSATSYFTPDDRHSAAIFMVSGITGASLSIDVGVTGSDVFRSIVAVYRVSGNVSVSDTADDLALAGDPSASVTLDIPSGGFCVAFASGMQNGGAVTIDSGATPETSLIAENFLLLTPASTETSGLGSTISASWLDTSTLGSLRLLAASFT